MGPSSSYRKTCKKCKKHTFSKFFNQEEYKYAFKHCSWPHIILRPFHKKDEKIELTLKKGLGKLR
jgi:hypothetical protein